MSLLSYFKILLLIIPIITNSQSIIWENNFGEILYDQGYSIELTEDNGYIIAGRKGAISESIENTPSLSVDGNFHIIKIQENGDVEWEQSYEDTTGFSYAKSIKKPSLFLPSFMPQEIKQNQIFLKRMNTIFKNV